MTRVSVDLRKELQNVHCLELFDLAIAFFVFSLCYSDCLDLSKLDIFLVFSLCYTDRLDLELELDLELKLDDFGAPSLSSLYNNSGGSLQYLQKTQLR